MSIDLMTKLWVASKVFELRVRREVERDIERIAGREFLEACKQDESCNLTIDEIAVYTVSEILEWIDRHERMMEIARRKAVIELKERLREMGARIWCSEHDLGEAGSYSECFVEYKGFDIPVEELADM